MNVFSLLENEARQKGLAFLVIGGHAVIYYGYPRYTGDLDLLIRKPDREAWLVLLQKLGFSILQDGGAFLQFQAPPHIPWPLDLMLVNEAAFQGMMAEAPMVKILDASVPVPSLNHLLALKLHALKNARLSRTLKDFQDVVALAEINRLDPKSEKMRQLFLKYADLEWYEKFVRSFDGTASVPNA